MSKVFLLTDGAYHESDLFFGAYSTLEKAKEAAEAFKVDPENNWQPLEIVTLNFDAPAEVHHPREVLDLK